MATSSSTLRIGVVGYGHLGQDSPCKLQIHTLNYVALFTDNMWMRICDLGKFLVEKILNEGPGLGLILAFVWNRNPDRLKGSVPAELILEDLSSFANRFKHTSKFTNRNEHTALSQDHRHVFKSPQYPFCTLTIPACFTGGVMWL